MDMDGGGQKSVHGQEVSDGGDPKPPANFDGPSSPDKSPKPATGHAPIESGQACSGHLVDKWKDVIKQASADSYLIGRRDKDSRIPEECSSEGVEKGLGPESEL